MTAEDCLREAEVCRRRARTCRWLCALDVFVAAFQAWTAGCYLAEYPADRWWVPALWAFAAACWAGVAAVNFATSGRWLKAAAEWEGTAASLRSLEGLLAALEERRAAHRWN